MAYNFKKLHSKRPARISIEDLKQKVSIREVVQELGITGQYQLQKTGDRLQGNCPSGHPSKGGNCFSISLSKNLFHCFHCQTSGDIVSLVMLCKNMDVKQAVTWLAEKFQPSLAKAAGEVKEEELVHEIEYAKHHNLFELIYEHGREQLLNDPNAQAVRDYLVNDRKYDLAALAQTEFIYWDHEKSIKDHLKLQLPGQAQQIDELPLKSAQGDMFRLAIPYRDMHGVITGFLKRAHLPKGFAGSMRWDSTPGLSKPNLFGLHRIEKDVDTVLVVEGYPDATYLPAVGLENIVAFGQAAFSEKYLEGFEIRGVRRIILALDNDGGTGEENTEKICRRFIEEDIKVFVIDPPSMGSCKDPDEFVAQHGVPAFKQLMDQAESAAVWMTKRLLSKHALSSDLERDRAIFEVMEYADSLENPREAETAVNTLASQLSLTDEVLLEEYRKLQENRASKRLQEGMKTVYAEADELLADGEVEHALRIVQNGVADLQSEFWRTKDADDVGLSDFLQEKKKLDATKTAGQRIGYELKDFAEIDKAILGLQTGLYLIGADPNIGKTALMVSLAIDVLRSNADVSVLFYSMDDSRDAIVNRLLAHLSDMRINEVRYQITDAAKQGTLDTAYEQVGLWAGGRRLDIRELSDSLTMSRIHNEIRQHPNREKLVVFIDGLYNVPVETDGGSIREENIDRANQVKQLVRSFNLPVLATTEFRKQGRDESSMQKKTRSIHDIMETGKYGYNADLVILLAPKDADAYIQQDEPIIVANFGKNKLESFRGSMEFKFIRAKSVMTIVPGTTVNP